MRLQILHSDNAFAFQLLGDDNQPVANSKPYPTVDACLEGIRAFVEVAASQPAFALGTENDKHLFTARLAGQELLRSIAFDSRSAALHVAETLREKFAKTRDFEVSYTHPRVQATKRPAFQSDLDSYDFIQHSRSGKAGFESLQNTTTHLYYFHYNDPSGQEFLYSQGYASPASRDNGIRSVIQNAPKQERYAQHTENGRFFFILKAINGREVARSRLFATAVEASSFATRLQQTAYLFEEQYQKPKRPRARNANPPVDSYRFQVASRSGLAGFESFQDDAKHHYFHFNDATGLPILFSQGYGNIAARDNGIRSVIRNAHRKDRYVLASENGLHSLILKAGNNQEIARSRPYANAAECETARVYLESNTMTYAAQYQVEMRGEMRQTTETQLFNIHVEPSSVPSRDIDGYDFEQASPTGTPGYESFYSGKNNAYYFHFNNSEGHPILFSESYPNAAVRDNGLASVQKNALQKDQWRVLQNNGRYACSLRAGNNQEIARSAWLDDEPAALGLLAMLQNGAAGIMPLSGVAAAGSSTRSVFSPQQPAQPSDIQLVDIPRPRPRSASETAPKTFPLYGYDYNPTRSDTTVHEPIAARFAPAETTFSIPKRAGWMAVGLLAVLAGGLWWYSGRQTVVPLAVGEIQANTAEPATTPQSHADLEKNAGKSPAPVVMTRFQPIALYFNNDHPNPRTQANTTALAYGQTFDDYYKQRNLIATAYSQGAGNSDAARTDVELFFEEKVKKGYENLNALSAQLLQKLDEGFAVEITVTGFASPLAPSEYNRLLTSRRVHSVENHFLTYGNGAFSQYLADKRLTITEQASGEDRAARHISDDRTDARRSRYSPEASAERRVEITNVTIRKALQ